MELTNSDGKLDPKARQLLVVVRRALIMLLPAIDALLGLPPTIPPKKGERSGREERQVWD